ncbi:hypothetical protein shim_37360 [Shimia sp. SK013]|uniref:hypothetical protein n=1 Tax=Shimia sp. SK013 TaxID=1389006 RepID=UPI0006B57392|nr:hypothetical protein [Shimia sp. SK013]KPA20070.1 hypothetical protein shim_37360 [Shimia sp. SK013]
MTEIEKTKPNVLGVKVKGSAQTGHKIEMAEKSALCQIFGTSDDKQANALLSHCLKVLKAEEATDEHPRNDERTFMLSVIRDLAPRDAVERMLAVQMAATHVATIRAGAWLSRSENLAQGKTHSTAYAKLARTFTSQVEALRKHRTGGRQTVTVQHVNVSDGGRAIVSNVQPGGRGGDE